MALVIAQWRGASWSDINNIDSNEMKNISILQLIMKWWQSDIIDRRKWFWVFDLNILTDTHSLISCPLYILGPLEDAQAHSAPSHVCTLLPHVSSRPRFSFCQGVWFPCSPPLGDLLFSPVMCSDPNPTLTSPLPLPIQERRRPFEIR